MPEPVWMSPLAHREPIAQGLESAIAISEIADRSMIDVRTGAGDTDAMTALEEVLGFALPTEPRTSTALNGRAALWLSIDQWLVAAPLEERSKLVTDLELAAMPHFSAITDMSDARAIIRMQGAGAREIVMKGAAVDLTRSDHSLGAVRRILFAEIAAMVHIAAIGPDILDLYIFRSYADYAWDWISKAAKPGASLRLFTAQDIPPV